MGWRIEFDDDGLIGIDDIGEVVEDEVVGGETTRRRFKGGGLNDPGLELISSQQLKRRCESRILPKIHGIGA